MPVRIGFDMDGVLADLSRAYHEVEADLLDPAPARAAGEPERRRRADHEEEEPADPAVLRPRVRRRQDKVWNAIRAIPNFWESLKPLEEGTVARIGGMMLRHSWEVFFITQRPATRGDTVQRQTQRWLVAQGFELPSVLVLGGSRGAAAGALGLNYHVDDSAQNCLDVLADSSARPILVVPDDNPVTVASARKVGIGTAPSLTACLDILERATAARAQPDVLAGIAASVGWK
jgi:hypothetical protein